jgi:hypothetical protein
MKETSEMPKVSKESAAHVENHGPVEDRHEGLDDYTVNFLTMGQTIDATPLFKGLPGDRCSCPHDEERAGARHGVGPATVETRPPGVSRLASMALFRVLHSLTGPIARPEDLERS